MFGFTQILNLSWPLSFLDATSLKRLENVRIVGGDGQSAERERERKRERKKRKEKKKGGLFHVAYFFSTTNFLFHHLYHTTFHRLILGRILFYSKRYHFFSVPPLRIRQAVT